jgi:hypothetical protein
MTFSSSSMMLLGTGSSLQTHLVGPNKGAHVGGITKIKLHSIFESSFEFFLALDGAGLDAKSCLNFQPNIALRISLQKGLLRVACG